MTVVHHMTSYGTFFFFFFVAKMVTPSNGRTYPKVTKAPDYDDPVYWDVKFSTGRDVGEWLNSGNALLDAVLAELDQRYPGAKGVVPRVLHLGPGISKLGTRLQEAFTSREWLGSGIIVRLRPRSNLSVNSTSC